MLQDSEHVAELSSSQSYTAVTEGFEKIALLRDSAGYFLGKVIPGFFGLISVPVFVRLIGLEEYGRLSVLLPVIMSLAGAGSGWLAQGVLRFHPLPGDSLDNKKAFDRAIVRGAIYSSVASIVILAGTFSIMRYGIGVSSVAGVYCAVLLSYSIVLIELQARLQPRSVVHAEALRALLGFLLPIFLVLITGRRTYVLILAGSALGYLSSLWFITRESRDIKSFSLLSRDDSKSFAILRQLWNFGWAVGLWLLLCQALPIVGRSALQHYAGYRAAGTYASIYEVAVRSFSFFAFPITQAAHPRIMQYWNQGQYHSAILSMRSSLRWQILMFLPIGAGVVLFSRSLTNLIVGSGTKASATLLPLLMLGGFLWQLALLAHKPLEIMRRTKTMLAGMTLVLLLELCGNYLLIPKLGPLTAVYVFVAGAVVYLIFVALNNPLLHSANSVNPANS